MNCNYAVAVRTTMYIHSIEFSYNIQLWPFINYNWLFQWDYIFYKWGFLSTYNWYNLGHNCRYSSTVRVEPLSTPLSSSWTQSREFSWDSILAVRLGSRLTCPLHPGSRRQETRPLSIPNLPGPLSITKSRGLAGWHDACFEIRKIRSFGMRTANIFWSHCSAHAPSPTSWLIGFALWHRNR